VRGVWGKRGEDVGELDGGDGASASEKEVFLCARSGGEGGEELGGQGRAGVHIHGIPYVCGWGCGPG